MADQTAAERQRRYRARQAAHKAGDHSQCDPARCQSDAVTVTPSITRNAVTVTAPDLGTRGRRLWHQITGDGPELRPAEQVLLEEACRSADRLDRLDRMLRGDEDAWIRFHSINEDGSIVQVVINNLLSEARQQQVAMKALLAELRTSRAEKPGVSRRGKGGQARTSGSGAQPAGKEGGGVVADLAAWVAGRRDQTAG